MMMLKIGFLGNCQAQILEALSRHIGLNYEFISFEPVWLYKKEDEGNFLDNIRKCDIIFTQRISEDYDIDFLRTSNIKSNFDNCISWPNAYFDGYFPTVSYIYTSHGKITGPLSDYHLPIIRAGWENGQPVHAVVNSIISPESSLFEGDPVLDSINKLAIRENGLDVKISDFIAENSQLRKIFFTPNHPYDEVLIEILSRLMQAAGLASPEIKRAKTFPYTLNNIQIPAMPGFFRRYENNIIQDDFIHGREITVESTRIGETGKSRIYNWEELVENYFYVYDAYKTAGFFS